MAEVEFKILGNGFFTTGRDIGLAIKSARNHIRKFQSRYAREQLQYFQSEVEKTRFSPGSIGRFSPGRGRKIQEGDRFANASGELLSQLLKSRFITYSPTEFGLLIQAKGEKAIEQEQIQQRHGRSLVGPTVIDLDQLSTEWLDEIEFIYNQTVTRTTIFS